MTTFTGCPKCLNTGKEPLPHSDEGWDWCDCETGRARWAVKPHPLGAASLAGDEMELLDYRADISETLYRFAAKHMQAPPSVADLTWAPIAIIAAIVFGPFLIGALL